MNCQKILRIYLCSISSLGRSKSRIGLLVGFFFSASICLAAANENDNGVSLSVTMSQESYAGKAQLSEQGSQYNYFVPELNIDIDRAYGSTKAVVRGNALGLVPLTNDEVISGAIPELYYQESFSGGGSSWTFGRMRDNWSELDRHWAIGLWQPLVKWDASRPIEQGLTGLFWETKGKSIRTNIFVSGLFLPDQQPLFKNQGGHLTSSNRWFREPVPALGFSQNYYDILYEINMPKVDDVVFQSSFAARLELGASAWDKNETGAFLRFSFSDKPANQFHIEMDGNFDLPGEPYANVYPHVIRHHLYTFETGYQWSYTRLLMSSTIEEFDPLRLNPNNYQSPIVDGRYDGFYVTQDLAPFNIKRTNLTISYINKTERDQSPTFSLLDKEVEASSQRILFSQLIGVKVDKLFFKRKNKELSALGQYTYSVSDKGEWFRLAMDYRFSRVWTLNIGGDIFGVPSDTPTNTSFISKYRGNDRLVGSVSYVF